MSKQKLSSTLAWMMITAGIGLLVLVGVQLATRPLKPIVDTVNVQPQPSSRKPTPQTVNRYTVAANAPKYINIPSIHLSNSRIIGLGLLKNGQIATPSNIYDAGWYRDSAMPGQSGVMFVFGHLSSWTTKGIFYDLHKLKPGDMVMIVRGDNSSFRYRVVSLKTYSYDAVDMDRVLSSAESGAPGLNLMTCAGKIIKGTSDFDQRLVVFTSQVASAQQP